MKKVFMCLAVLLLGMVSSVQAQLAYQVSLLNTATGEARANVTVNAKVTITNSANEQIYTTTQTGTTNDMGVLQLVVGDANTFKGIDTGKLPLFIEVSVDGVTVGKSQILTVPVAEIANTLKSSFTKEDLIGTWLAYIPNFAIAGIEGSPFSLRTYLIFNEDYVKLMSEQVQYSGEGKYMGISLVETAIYPYEIEGNSIYYIESLFDSHYGIMFDSIRELKWHNRELYDVGDNWIRSKYTKQ